MTISTRTRPSGIHSEDASANYTNADGVCFSAVRSASHRLTHEDQEKVDGILSGSLDTVCAVPYKGVES